MKSIHQPAASALGLGVPNEGPRPSNHPDLSSMLVHQRGSLERGLPGADHDDLPAGVLRGFPLIVGVHRYLGGKALQDLGHTSVPLQSRGYDDPACSQGLTRLEPQLEAVRAVADPIDLVAPDLGDQAFLEPVSVAQEGVEADRNADPAVLPPVLGAESLEG